MANWRPFEYLEVNGEQHCEGDLLNMEEWINCVTINGWRDEDGYASYATRTMVNDQSLIRPSYLHRGLVDLEQTHVIWYPT